MSRDTKLQKQMGKRLTCSMVAEVWCVRRTNAGWCCASSLSSRKWAASVLLPVSRGPTNSTGVPLDTCISSSHKYLHVNRDASVDKKTEQLYIVI